MLRLAFDFIITWRETRTRPNAYGKTDKDSRGTRMVSFSLQTVEYLINLPHRRQCLIPTPAPLP